MGIRVIQIDAFTNRRFAGNAAAVCLVEEEQDDHWMQSVAAEMNLSGTAFIRPLDTGFGLRFFTPAIEVDLSGHITLASTHALWTEGVVTGNTPIEFHTNVGILACTTDAGFIHLDLPATPAEQVAPPRWPTGCDCNSTILCRPDGVRHRGGRGVGAGRSLPHSRY